MEHIVTDKIFDAVTINATASVSSELINLWECHGNFAVHVTSLTGTTPNLKIEYNICPLQQGTFYEPSSAPDIVSVLTAAPDAFAFDPIPAAFMKIKITGNATNGSNTVITAYLTRSVERARAQD